MEISDVDHYIRKSLKNLSQVCGEAANCQETSEVAVQIFQGHTDFKGGSQDE